MDELIGKTIKRLWVNADESLLVFETDQGDIAYETYGDCCSETWFADIIGVKDLLGQIVQGVEEVEMGSIFDGRARQEEDRFYGVKLSTPRGISDIVYRNSSNGYYGGSITYQREFTRPDDLREITGDWQAP